MTAKANEAYIRMLRWGATGFLTFSIAVGSTFFTQLNRIQTDITDLKIAIAKIEERLSKDAQ